MLSADKLLAAVLWIINEPDLSSANHCVDFALGYESLDTCALHDFDDRLDFADVLHTSSAMTSRTLESCQYVHNGLDMFAADELLRWLSQRSSQLLFLQIQRLIDECIILAESVPAYSSALIKRPRRQAMDTCDLGKSDGESAPRTGFEPVTLRLTAACSTVELPRNGLDVVLAPPVFGAVRSQRDEVYTIAGAAVKRFVQFGSVFTMDSPGFP